MGEKGLFMKTESLYECLLHVPLIIRPPRHAEWAGARRVSGLVDNVDLFPTILGMAGARVPEYAQGHDLMSWAAGGAARPLRDVAFAQVGEYGGNLKTTMPSGIIEVGRHRGLLQGARSTEYSYVRDPDYGDEAYDLRADPGELVDLLRDSGGHEPPQLNVLRRRIDQWARECQDLSDQLGVRPGYRGFDDE
jgi:arylsulfatase A-like enzyme